MSQPTPRRTHLQPFKSFDEAMQTARAQSFSGDLDDLRREGIRLAGLLPQRNAIKNANLDRWVDSTIKTCVEEAQSPVQGDDALSEPDLASVARKTFLWHLRRASAFGGSDAGTVVKHYRGEPADFQDARNLTLEKLLVLAPQVPTPEMMRGHRAEPWLAEMYEKKNPSAIRDTKSLEQLRGFRWEKTPFLLGTPDDMIFEPDENGQRRRRLLDYKCPSADVIADYEANGMSFSYICQLHDYALLASAAKTGFNPYSHPMSIEAFDPRSFDVASFPIEFSPELMREIANTSRNLWHDHVMTGELPDPPRPDELDIHDHAVITMGTQLAILKLVNEAFDTRMSEMRDRIAALGSDWHDKSEGNLSLGIATLARKRKWDEEKLRELASSAGVDINDFESDDKTLDPKLAHQILKDLVEAPDAEHMQQIVEQVREDGLPFKRKLDADALAEHLESLDVSTVEAAGIRESFSLTRKKKGIEAETLATLRDQTSELADQVEDQAIRDMIDTLMNPEAAAQVEDMDMDP